MNKIEYDANINFTHGLKPTKFGINDNIAYTKDFNNMDLFCNFLKINENWKCGIGAGIYEGGRAFLRIEDYQSNFETSSVQLDVINIGNESTSFSVMQGNLDFQFYTQFTREINISLNEKKQMDHFLGLGIGFTNNKKNDDLKFTEFGKNYFDVDESHKLLPFLKFIYEFGVNTKNKNLFNLIFTYQQGIFKVANFSFEDVYNLGPYSKLSAVTRGSSICLGLTKSFDIKKSTKLGKE